MQDDLRKMRSYKFLVTIWCYYQIWKGRHGLAEQYFALPSHFKDAIIKGDKSVLPWELDGLLGVYLRAYDNLTDSHLLLGEIDPMNYHNSSVMINSYKELVSSESLGDIDTSTEKLMHILSRIAWQQFPWQVGYDHPSTIIRYCSLYYGPQCKQAFHEKHGLPSDVFFTICLALSHHFQQMPIFLDVSFLEKYGVPSRSVRKALAIIARTPKAASKEIRLRGEKRSVKTEFANNQTFDYPVFLLSNGKNFGYICPFPELLIHRATYGIYFDVIWNQAARREAAKSLEVYCCDYIRSTCGSMWQVIDEFQYGPKKTQTHSPDVLLTAGHEVGVAIECKARKIPEHVRISSNPFLDYPDSYSEIAHGVYQTWRFRRDLSNGIVQKYSASKEFSALVVTLEPWTDITFLIARKINALATEINEGYAGSDKYVKAEHRVAPAIIDVPNFEAMLRRIKPDRLPAYANHLAAYQNGNESGPIDDTLFLRESPIPKHPLGNRADQIMPLAAEFRKIRARKSY